MAFLLPLPSIKWRDMLVIAAITGLQVLLVTKQIFIPLLFEVLERVNIS
jgi:hypothetical protein